VNPRAMKWRDNGEKRSVMMHNFTSKYHRVIKLRMRFAGHAARIGETKNFSEDLGADESLLLRSVRVRNRSL
jgi:hypothetical protein